MSCGGATGAAACLSMTFSLVLEFNSKARKNAAAAGKEEAIACGALDTAAGRTEEMVFNGVAAECCNASEADAEAEAELELEMEMEADEGDTAGNLICTDAHPAASTASPCCRDSNSVIFSFTSSRFVLPAL